VGLILSIVFCFFFLKKIYFSYYFRVNRGSFCVLIFGCFLIYLFGYIFLSHAHTPEKKKKKKKKNGGGKRGSMVLRVGGENG
jgi:uncharacterized membrane protein YfcA